MPWLGYVPTDEDHEYWGTYPDGLGHKVSSWPHPSTPRVDARYRMEHGLDMFPSAQRFLVRNFFSGEVDLPMPSNVEVWSWLDLLPVAGGHIEGTLPENDFGCTLRVSVRSYTSLPALAVPGVRIEIETAIDGKGSSLYWEEWVQDGQTLVWQPRSQNWVSQATLWGFIVDPLWPWANFKQFFQSCSECYDFPQQSDPPGGFAEFNGVDSYVALSFSVNSFSLPFRVTYEFRYRTPNDWQPLWGNFDAGGFFGMRGTRNIFGNRDVPTSWTQDADLWHTWRYDFEQSGQLGHTLYIDGFVVMDAVGARQFMQANRLGVYKQGGIGVLWSHMDVRNLKYVTGIDPAFTTVLDMPLLFNALDNGPQANHGTTFNMDLPSV